MRCPPIGGNGSSPYQKRSHGRLVGDGESTRCDRRRSPTVPRRCRAGADVKRRGGRRGRSRRRCQRNDQDPPTARRIVGLPDAPPGPRSVAAALRRDSIPTRVLLLSAHDDAAIVYQALQGGAAGFMPKESTRSEIVNAVLDCAKGLDVLSAGIAGGLAKRFAAVPNHPRRCSVDANARC